MTATFLAKKSFALSAALGAIVLIGACSAAHAQTTSQPQMLITWQAYGSYIPPEYTDKALPNVTSKLTASLMLFDQGKKVDLSGQTIYWYEDDTQIGGGSGATSVSFSPFGGAPNFVTLKAEIPSYNGNVILHDIQIPIIQPKAVIEANHPTANFNDGSLALQGTPYFFRVSSLSSLTFAWSVNGASPAAAINPQTLDLNVNPNTPSGSSFTTSLTITDPSTRMTADDSVALTYAKQL